MTAAAPPPAGPGLTAAEAQARLARYGPNAVVPAEQPPTLLDWLRRPLTDPMVVLLLGAGLVYLILGDTFDALVVLVALVPIATVTLALEARAERALARLRRLAAPTARVWRDGHLTTRPVTDLVPGDVVLLAAGDIVPADGLIIAGGPLVVEESALTGESQPVTKVGEGGPEERSVWAGTTVLAGQAVVQITATGRRTRYGQIGLLLATIRQPPTPLQKAIGRLIRRLAVLAVLLCVGVAGLALLTGRGWTAAVTAGVSLGVAAIPEEFPMVYALFLAVGAWRLARHRALVRRLVGVETLGSVTVICTDKTGTLTEGRLALGALVTPAGLVRPGDRLTPDARRLLEAAVLASEPVALDPLDQAILAFARASEIDVAALHHRPLVRDYPFDPRRRLMAHAWAWDGQIRLAAKGAVEGIIASLSLPADQRAQVLALNQRLATEGMRVLAVAVGDLPALSGDWATDARALRLVGLVAFSDPVRPGVPEALQECRPAGIRVSMLTGDHPVTAHAVAEAIGLPHPGDEIITGDDLDRTDDRAIIGLVRRATIFARIRPEQKYRLVRALRASGEVVAMTGDGINDAPALREADIGIAMGQRGTDVARAAATMVLLDDNFATIVRAIREGRHIFAGLQRAFSYLVAFHTPLLVGAFVVPLLGLPLFLLPAHLIWLELLMHPTAALVFEYDPPPPDLMRRPPRPPGAQILTLAGFLQATVRGLVLAASALGLYGSALAVGAPVEGARSLGLATLVLGQIGLVLVERAPDQPFWQRDWRGNWALLAIPSATLLSLGVVCTVPAVGRLFQLAPLTAPEWALALLVAVGAAFWEEPLKAWRTRPAAGRAA